MFLDLCCVRLGVSAFTELLRCVTFSLFIPPMLTTHLTFLRKTWVSCVVNMLASSYAPIKSKLQHPPHLPGKARAFELLKLWIVQIPTRLSQNSVQVPYSIVGFVCQMPLLKNNSPVGCNKACVETCQHMSRDPLYDDAVYKNTTLILKLLKMT